MASWMLRIKVDSCIDKWKSVYIGRNYFTRKEQRVGPRKRFGTHTPGGYSPQVRINGLPQSMPINSNQNPGIDLEYLSMQYVLTMYNMYNRTSLFIGVTQTIDPSSCTVISSIGYI